MFHSFIQEEEEDVDDGEDYKTKLKTRENENVSVLWKKQTMIKVMT